jgi:hypothetical protein
MVAKLLDYDYNVLLLFVLPFEIHLKLKLKLDDRIMLVHLQIHKP